MAKTPETVMSFLKQQHSQILPLAKKEYHALLDEKFKVEGRHDKVSKNKNKK